MAFAPGNLSNRGRQPSGGRYDFSDLQAENLGVKPVEPIAPDANRYKPPRNHNIHAKPEPTMQDKHLQYLNRKNMNEMIQSSVGGLLGLGGNEGGESADGLLGGLGNMNPSVASDLLDVMNAPLDMQGNALKKVIGKIQEQNRRQESIDRQKTLRNQAFLYNDMPEQLKNQMSFREYQQMLSMGIDPKQYMLDSMGPAMSAKVGLPQSFGQAGGKGMSTSGWRQNETGQVTGNFNEDMAGMRFFSGAGGGGGGGGDLNVPDTGPGFDPNQDLHHYKDWMAEDDGGAPWDDYEEGDEFVWNNNKYDNKLIVGGFGTGLSQGETVTDE